MSINDYVKKSLLDLSPLEEDTYNKLDDLRNYLALNRPNTCGPRGTYSKEATVRVGHEVISTLSKIIEESDCEKKINSAISVLGEIGGREELDYLINLYESNPPQSTKNWCLYSVSNIGGPKASDTLIGHCKLIGNVNLAQAKFSL